jgi:hypothetical protein
VGEIVDAIKAVAELGKDSASVLRPEVERIEKKVKELEEKSSAFDSIAKKVLELEALKLQRLGLLLSSGKFLSVVIGATLVMWLAGHHVVGLLRPKAPNLAQRIEAFSSEHDSNAAAAAAYLSECIALLEVLRNNLAAGDAGQSKDEKPRQKQPLIPAQKVTTLRELCSKIVGE